MFFMKTPDRRTSYLVIFRLWHSDPHQKVPSHWWFGSVFLFFSSTFKARSLQLSFRWGNNECVNSDTSTHSSTMYIVRLCHQINETMTFGQSGIMRDNETHMARPHTHTDYIYHWPQAVGPSCSLPALCPSHNVTSTRLTAANRVQHCCLPRLAQSLCAPPWS